MEMEIDYYEFDPVEYNGKTVYGFGCPAVVEYASYEDSWDYPLASQGSRRETFVDIRCFHLTLSVSDEHGEPIYEDDDDVPADLRAIYTDMFDSVAEELVKEKS